jgi:hypothetical protein
MISSTVRAASATLGLATATGARGLGPWSGAELVLWRFKGHLIAPAILPRPAWMALARDLASVVNALRKTVTRHTPRSLVGVAK